MPTFATSYLPSKLPLHDVGTFSPLRQLVLNAYRIPLNTQPQAPYPQVFKQHALLSSFTWTQNLFKFMAV